MTDHHPYDEALKSLLGSEAAQIVPHLLSGAQIIGEHNIEIDRTTLKADLVYTIWYRDQLHTLNLELQTGEDKDMVLRLLQYHIGLYVKHRRPVISVVLYLFEDGGPHTPFEEKSGDQTLLSFHFEVLLLRLLDARTFVQERTICMYTLLPAMQGANATLLMQAIDEMEQYYTPRELGHHLGLFKVILRRSRMVSKEDKMLVEEKLHHFNSLIDTDPEFMERFEQKRKEGMKEGEMKGRVEELQLIVHRAIEDVYPALVPLAQKKISSVRQLDVLRQLVKQIYMAPDEQTVHWLLNTLEG